MIKQFFIRHQGRSVKAQNLRYALLLLLSLIIASIFIKSPNKKNSIPQKKSDLITANQNLEIIEPTIQTTHKDGTFFFLQAEKAIPENKNILNGFNPQISFFNPQINLTDQQQHTWNLQAKKLSASFQNLKMLQNPEKFYLEEPVHIQSTSGINLKSSSIEIDWKKSIKGLDIYEAQGQSNFGELYMSHIQAFNKENNQLEIQGNIILNYNPDKVAP